MLTLFLFAYKLKFRGNKLFVANVLYPQSVHMIH